MKMVEHSSVFITGASSGIGLQLAKDYADSDCKVYACGRSEERLFELTRKRPAITPLIFDATDKEQISHALKSIDVPPSLWILNAGNCEYVDDGYIDSVLIRRVFEANVMGTVNVLEGIQSSLAPGHRVVIVGSIASEVALPRAEAYGGSKAALSYIARGLQLDWARKRIDVSIVFPGFVKTPLTDKNTFSMPMLVTPERASLSIRSGIAKGHSSIYFPRRFTSILRVMSMLPYRWQTYLAKRLL
jgi:short-subunit dehydrogenase